MGEFSRIATMLHETFTAHGYEGFLKALEPVQKADKSVNIALSSQAPPDPASVGVLLSEVKPEAIHWLWPGYIALRKLHTFDGDPSLGKSTLRFDIIARLTSSKVMPGEERASTAGVRLLVWLEVGIGSTFQRRRSKPGTAVAQVGS